MREKPACVLRRDARLTELRQLEDRESLRPWLEKYGCFEIKKAWSSTGIVHFDNLKELAKRLRLHKSIPNFFRDYITEDSLVAVLKRYVRNNAAFLSAASSVDRARRVENSQTDVEGAAAVSGGDEPNVVGYTTSVDGTFSLEGRVTTNSGDIRVAARDDSIVGVLVTEMTTTTAGESKYSQRACGVSVGRYGGVLSSDVAQACGTGGPPTAQVLKGSIFAPSGTAHSSVGGRRQRSISVVPRRPIQPKRPAKASILLSPNAGGRKLFGHSGADNMAGMILMSRMGLSSQNVDRLQIIFRQDQQHSRISSGAHRSQTEMSAQGAGASIPSVGDIGGIGDERSEVSVPAIGGRQGAQAAPSGLGISSTSKQKAPSGGTAIQRKKNEDGDGSFSPEDTRSAGWGGSGDCVVRLVDGIKDGDYSQMIKIKAAQALFIMSLEPGGEMKMVRDGVVIALKKLVKVESVLAHRLVSGCLVNLTTTRNVAWELLRRDGHQVLAFLVNGVKAPDSIVLTNVATALCRCSYEARNHHCLVAEFNTAQALCYIMQRQDVNLQITSAKGILNICGLSSTIPALAAKLDVWMLMICSALEDLAKNENEAIQTFVCQAIQGLTSVSMCLTRIPESGVVDLFLPLVKLNQKIPENLARLTAAVVNLADLPSAHTQLVKQKDIVAVLRLLSTRPRLVESCCIAAANFSRTRDLETYLAPLAMTLVESSTQNENAVDCIAYFLQNVTRSHPMTESVVTSWLAAGADSASSDGRLACLCAIGNLTRHRGDVDTPLLRAGLMGTLHAILDELTAPAMDEVQGGTTADPSTSSASSTSTSSRASTRIGKDGASSLISPIPSSLARCASRGITGSTTTIRKAIATTQKRKKRRDDLMRLGEVMLDRILAVITKICYSLTIRTKNAPRLVKQDLPGLCAKILKLTKDENIQFMAVACIYSLTRSPNFRSKIAESGAAEFALDALAQSAHESEYILAQLGLIARMAEEPKIRRRLASTATVDLLEKLSLGRSGGKDFEPSTFDVFNARKNHNNCENNSHDESHNHGSKKSLGGICSKSNGSLDEAHIPQRSGGSKPTKVEMTPGKRVQVASPFLSAVRYSVVTIAEHLGATLNDGGAFGRKLSPSDVSSMVEKLVHMVCSVILTSGPDEALMGCCARVIAKWSIDPKFSREMGVKSYTGLSLAALMRSVAPATMARASTALSNIAATNMDNVQLRAGSPDADCRPATIDKATVGTGEETGDERPTNPTSYSRENGRHSPEGSASGGAVCGDDYWLRSTDLLREIVTRGLVRSTAEVKGNLIKAVNNLMCSEKTRAVLVMGNYTPLLFDLVRGNTPEIRGQSSEILYNLTCEDRFHTTLLESGVVYALLELLGPLQHGLQEIPATATRSAQVIPAPNNSSVVGAQTKSTKAVAQTPDGAKNTQALTGSNQRFDAFGTSAASRTSGDDSTINTMTSAQDDDSTALHTLPRQGKPGGIPVIEQGISGAGRTAGAAGEGGGGAVQGGGGARASLLVRQNVLGAIMNLTRCSLSHPKLEPSLVMVLLSMIMQDYPDECPDEETFGDLWVSWHAVILQLSFEERYRSLIVYHGEGQVFQHVKLTNDPLSLKSSELSPLHDRAYKRLIMGTMVNIACEPSLYEELEWQVQVLREFLAEYEQEASGGCTRGGSRGGMGGRAYGSGGNGGDSNLGGCEDDVGDAVMDDTNGRGRGICGGSGGGGDVRGGNNGVGDEDSLSDGWDWVRHELCSKLVSNLFSSKSLRERLSKKPIAGILVGLLCGPPTRRVTSSAQSNVPSPATPTRSVRSPGNIAGDFKAVLRPGHSAGGDAKLQASKATRRSPLPEGSEELRPALYSGGDEAAVIASRFLCEICILHLAEGGGFELPPRTFEGLMKIAHYYNYNPSASTASAIRPDDWGIGGESATDVANELLIDPQGKGGKTTDVLSTWADGPMASKSEEPPIDPQPTGCSGGTVHSDENGDTEHYEDDVDSGSSKVRSTKCSTGQFTSESVTPTWPRSGGESSGDGIEQRQIPVVPLSPQSSKQHDGNDSHGDRWSRTRQGQGYCASWLATARELTQLWVRAVGSLCNPAHSDLWPLMIDAGIVGALFICISSPSISGDNEGLLICSASLRVLSTATRPCSLRGDQVAACFGAAQRLLLRGSTQSQLRVDCTVAIVNFVDASQVQDLQNLGVDGLLSDICAFDEKDVNDGSSVELLRDLAIYGLSKLCTRDFVPTGEHVVATITTMMDFDADTINRLDDLIKTPTAPPIASTGPWRFLQPNKNLGASALAMLDKHSRQTERTCESSSPRDGQEYLDEAFEVESGSDKDFRFWDNDARWKLRVTSFNEKMPEKSKVSVPETAQSKSTRSAKYGQRGKRVSIEGAIGTGTVAESAATSNGQELVTGENGGNAKSAKTEMPTSTSIIDVIKTSTGGAGRARGPNAKQKLKMSVRKVAASVIETSMMASFGSASTGPVNLEARILQNPVLTREDPPFELPWLLNYSEDDRAQLFRKSMESVWTGVNRVEASVIPATEDAKKATDEDGFHILTVPDDKWISLDVPPEAGQQFLV